MAGEASSAGGKWRWAALGAAVVLGGVAVLLTDAGKFFLPDSTPPLEANQVEVPWQNAAKAARRRDYATAANLLDSAAHDLRRLEDDPRVHHFREVAKRLRVAERTFGPARSYLERVAELETALGHAGAEDAARHVPWLRTHLAGAVAPEPLAGRYAGGGVARLREGLEACLAPLDRALAGWVGADRAESMHRLEQAPSDLDEMPKHPLDGAGDAIERALAGVETYARLARAERRLEEKQHRLSRLVNEGHFADAAASLRRLFDGFPHSVPGVPPLALLARLRETTPTLRATLTSGAAGEVRDAVAAAESADRYDESIFEDLISLLEGGHEMAARVESVRPIVERLERALEESDADGFALALGAYPEAVPTGAGDAPPPGRLLDDLQNGLALVRGAFEPHTVGVPKARERVQAILATAFATPDAHRSLQDLGIRFCALRRGVDRAEHAIDAYNEVVRSSWRVTPEKKQKDIDVALRALIEDVGASAETPRPEGPIPASPAEWKTLREDAATASAMLLRDVDQAEKLLRGIEDLRGRVAGEGARIEARLESLGHWLTLFHLLFQPYPFHATSTARTFEEVAKDLGRRQEEIEAIGTKLGFDPRSGVNAAGAPVPMTAWYRGFEIPSDGEAYRLIQEDLKHTARRTWLGMKRWRLVLDAARALRGVEAQVRRAREGPPDTVDYASAARSMRQAWPSPPGPRLPTARITREVPAVRLQHVTRRLATLWSSVERTDLDGCEQTLAEVDAQLDAFVTETERPPDAEAFRAEVFLRRRLLDALESARAAITSTDPRSLLRVVEGLQVALSEVPGAAPRPRGRLDRLEETLRGELERAAPLLRSLRSAPASPDTPVEVAEAVGELREARAAWPVPDIEAIRKSIETLAGGADKLDSWLEEQRYGEEDLVLGREEAIRVDNHYGAYCFSAALVRMRMESQRPYSEEIRNCLSHLTRIVAPDGFLPFALLDYHLARNPDDKHLQAAKKEMSAN